MLKLQVLHGEPGLGGSLHHARLIRFEAEVEVVSGSDGPVPAVRELGSGKVKSDSRIPRGT